MWILKFIILSNIKSWNCAMKTRTCKDGASLLKFINELSTLRNLIKLHYINLHNIISSHVFWIDLFRISNQKNFHIFKAFSSHHMTKFLFSPDLRWEHLFSSISSCSKSGIKSGSEYVRENYVMEIKLRNVESSLMKPPRQPNPNKKHTRRNI